MKKIDALKLSGTKTYFSFLDSIPINQPELSEEERRELDHRLKAAVLLNRTVALPAAFLFKPAVYRFFKAEPSWLTGEIVTVSLRDNISDFDEFRVNSAGYTKIPDSRDWVKFYSDNVPIVLRWSSEDTVDWFRQKILGDLKDRDSVIATGLSELSVRQIKLSMLYEKIEKTGEFIRTEIRRYTPSILTGKEADLFSRYLDIVYYISGARSHNCSPAIAQERLVDYRLDPDGSPVTLSDKRILAHIVELVSDQVQGIDFPRDYLDKLNQESVAELRKQHISSQFQDEIDKLLRKAAKIYNPDSGECDLFELQDLLEIEEKIQRSLVHYVEQDIENWKKFTKTVERVEWLRKVGSYALGFSVGGPIGVAVAATLDGAALVLDAYEFVSKKKLGMKNKITEWKIDQARKLTTKLGKEAQPITEFLNRFSKRLRWKD